jgi:hypothetical protein
LARAASVQKLGTTWKVTTPRRCRTGEGSDTLVSIERLSFADKIFELVRPATRAPSAAWSIISCSLVFTCSAILNSCPAKRWPPPGISTRAPAAANNAPNTFFDAAYYANRWPTSGLNLTPDPVPALQPVRSGGRSAGPKFDQFNGARYLSDNPDVAAYVDANVAD